jgi:hypothetical protein
MAKVLHGLKWLGWGFLVGVPSRDLKPDEVKKYGKDWLLASGLYQEFQPKRGKNAEEPVEDKI